MFFKNKFSFLDKFTGISGIVTATLLSIKLAYEGIISIETAALVIVGVVILNAVGTNVIKILQSALAIYLFCKAYSNGSQEQFNQILYSLLQLGIVLLGIYIMFRGSFRQTK